jgi:SAM-dependent methyltransferase
MFLTALLHLEDVAPGRLLEVGCGNGAFLATAASSGWSAVGVDFDPRAVAAAASLPGVQAWAGDLLEAPFEESDFNAIVMNNVLEHLDRPLETLTRCRQLLKPGGRFVAVTPNSRSMGHGLFKSGWRGLEPPRHLNIFGPTSLRKIARQAGFSNVTTFTSSGGSSGRYMLDASRGRRVNAPAVLGLEKLLAMLGAPVGEWGVLICHA